MGLTKAAQVYLHKQSTFARVVYTLFADSKGIQTYRKTIWLRLNIRLLQKY